MENVELSGSLISQTFIRYDESENKIERKNEKDAAMREKRGREKKRERERNGCKT